MAISPITRRWNLLKAAGYGAIAGIVYTGASMWLQQPNYSIRWLLDTAIGATVVGAVLFGLVAAVRNWSVRSK